MDAQAISGHYIHRCPSLLLRLRLDNCCMSAGSRFTKWLPSAKDSAKRDAAADAPMVPANAQPPASDMAADPGDEAQEWDLNDPQDVMDVIEHRFPFKDAEKAGFTLAQFSKIAAFYIDFLKKKSPKAPLSQHFKEDLDKGVVDSSKQRIAWLNSFAAQRAKQYLTKPEKAKAKLQ